MKSRGVLIVASMLCLVYIAYVACLDSHNMTRHRPREEIPISVDPVLRLQIERVIDDMNINSKYDTRKTSKLIRGGFDGALVGCVSAALSGGSPGAIVANGIVWTLVRLTCDGTRHVWFGGECQ
jgi:hypothetical protein